MSDNRPTFTFENGQAYAIFDNKVIASGPAEKLAEVEDSALAYLESLNTEKEAKVEAERQRKATHIITPNGLKGRILGQTPDIYGGQEVTVRYENNHVSSHTIHGGEGYQWISESTSKTASSEDPVEKLASRLDEEYETDEDSLVIRSHELQDISKEARHIVTFGNAPLTVQQRVSSIHTAAEAELAEVRQVLAQIEEKKANDEYGYKPFESQVVIQSDLGPTAHQASWLDITASEMIEESESQDFDRLLAEGPAVFVAGLDDGAVAHAGSVGEMARDFIQSKTAGFQGEEVEEYRTAFVARSEVARRHELATRKATEQQKVAAAEENNDFPDEALFG